MAVTERLMKPGRFTVQLRARTPRRVWSAVSEFDHIVITPTRVLPVGLLSDSTVLASAIYSGVVTEKPTNKSIGGQGPAYWLGTDDGLGDIIDSKIESLAAAGLNAWLPALLPSSIALGTVNTAGTTGFAGSYMWTTRREAIDHVCRGAGGEWRVNPDFTIDVAAPQDLFPNYTTPNAVITRKPEGRSNGKYGIEATDITTGSDVQGYTTKVIVVGKPDLGENFTTGSAGPVTAVYKDAFNNDVVMERLVNAPAEASSSISAYAAAVLDLYDTKRRSIKLSSRTYATTARVGVGDRVYVWDLADGITDPANSITWRGETIAPMLLRCKGITWPIKKGMGVYARRSGATPTYTDLSDWVQRETSDTQWEVGTSIFDTDQDPKQLGAAYLGYNPEVQARQYLAPKIDMVPTWSGTLGNGTLTGYYQIIGERCFVYFELIWGSTTSHGASSQLFTMPAAVPLTLVEDGGWLGGARLIGTAANRSRSLVRAAGTIGLMDEGGTFVTNLVPWTWTTGHKLIAQASWPL